MSYQIGIVILHVGDIARSRAFYTQSLGLSEVPEQSGPTFAVLRTAGDTLLALEQALAAPAGFDENERHIVEIGFEVPNVDPAWQDWHAKGVPMLTEPAKTPFGRIFEARDPDGYPLNVYELSRPA